MTELPLSLGGAVPAPERGLRRFRDPAFARCFMDGMRSAPKSVPCKYFYDETGSDLFDRICTLPEYYQTRTEMALLARHAKEFASLIGPKAELIEFGAGALKKVRILLDALEAPAAYIPIDISGEYLASVCAALDRDYPKLLLRPIVGDFTRPFALPTPALGTERRVGFFPGSTIGNFRPEEAVSLLKTAAGILKGGGLLIGADLVKDPAILHAAYNDAEGVTAAFNKNLLVRANNELDADFDLDAFAHYACYNPLAARIEMYLVSLKDQRVRAAGEEFVFAAGEAVHTEDSHKYAIASFQALARAAGFTPAACWTDPDNLFSVHWLTSPVA
jgi:dimethylhistidine N-methyltransferase